jgi:hypothetical protein
MPNRTLHRTMPHQTLPRAGLRYARQLWLSPADWLAVTYTVAGLAVLAICWSVTALPADCLGQCLVAHLR